VSSGERLGGKWSPGRPESLVVRKKKAGDETRKGIEGKKNRTSALWGGEKLKEKTERKEGVELGCKKLKTLSQPEGG